MRVDNEMATRIAIDTVGAASSLRALTNAVQSTTNAWKSQETAQKLAGDAIGASETRYNGLGETIDRQKTKIEELKSRQDSLIQTNQETARTYEEYEQKVAAVRSELQNLDTSTESGRQRAEQLKAQLNDLDQELLKGSDVTQKDAEAFLKLEKDINTAEKQLTAYEVQQKKAKETMEYYTSGLAGLQKGYRSTNEMAKAFVERLEAEGKESDANKAKLGNLRQSLVDLNAQYEIQTKELNSIAAESGKTSEAWQKQKTRVDQTATSLAKVKSQILQTSNSLDSLRKQTTLSQSATDSLTKGLNDLGRTNEAQKTKLTGLAEEHKALSNQLKAEKQYLIDLGSTFGTANDKYQEQAIKVSDLTNKYQMNELELKSLNRSVGEMSSSMAHFKDNVALTGTAVKDGFSKMKSSATTAAVGIGLVGAAMVSGADKASNLQSSYKETTNLLITSGEKSAEAISNVTKMQQDGEKYSLRYGKSQQEISEQYQELVRRGYTSKEALGAMNSELQASVASHDSFADTVKVSSQVLDAFGLKTDNTSKMISNTKKVVNELAYAGDNTAADFGSLGTAMEYVGTTSHNAKFSLSETSAALGVMSNHALEGDKAGTGLRKVIVSLAKTTPAADEALKQIGITSTDVFKKTNGDFKSLSDIMGIINDKTRELNSSKKEAVFKAIFGATGMEAAQILATDNAGLRDLTERTQEAGEAGSYVQQLAEKNSQTAQMSQEKFKQSWNDLTIMFGAKMLPYMTQAADELTKLFAKEGFRKEVGQAADDLGKVAYGILQIAKYCLDHGDQVKTFAGILATIWVVDKVRKFARATQDLFDLLGTGFKKITGETVAVEAETKAYQQLAAAKSEAAVAGEAGGTIGKTESTGKAVASEAVNAAPLTEGVEKAVTKSSSKWSILGKTIGSRIINAAGIAITAWDVGSSISKAVTSGKASDKYTAGGKTVGTLIGGGIGAAIAGAPGAAIGAQIGDQIGGSKTVTNAVKKLNDNLAKQPVKLNTKDSFDSLPKNAQKAVKKVNDNFKKLDKLNLKVATSTDPKEIAKTKNEINKVYQDLEKSSNQSTKKRTNDEKKFLEQELNDHQISQSQYKKYIDNLDKYDANHVSTNKKNLDKLKSNDSQMNKQIELLNKQHQSNMNNLETGAAKSREKITKSKNKDLEKLEKDGYVKINGQYEAGALAKQDIEKRYDKQQRALSKKSNSDLKDEEKNGSEGRKEIIEKYAKQRVKDEKKLGTDVAGELSSSSKQQKAILQKLSADKGHISDKEAEKLINNSAKAANKQIDDANNEYKQTVKAATDKANETIDQAKWLHDQAHAISTDQMNKLIQNANDERDSTIAAAGEKKKETVQTAKDQNKQVVDHAKDESKSVATHAQREGENGIYAWRQQAGGIFDVVNWIVDMWNKVTAVIKGTKMSHADKKIDTGYPQIKTGAYATGTGALSGLTTALVGEAGPELAYKPYSGSVRILGAQGAEFANIESGEYILDAAKTQKVINGSYHGILPGYSIGNIAEDSFDFLGDAINKAKNFVGDVSKEVRNILDKPKELIQSVSNKINGNGMGEYAKGWIGSIHDGLVNGWTNAIKKLKDVIGEAVDNPAGTGVNRWIPVIKKAAAKMQVNLTDSSLQVILHRIAQESNGNPTITNNWDSNAAAGHPSKGLLQYIQPTLNAWVPPGVKPDLSSGYSQIAAMFNDSNWLSDISVHGGWGPTGFKRFENGGYVSNDGLYRLAEGNKQEAIIPMDSTKRSRSITLLKEVVDQFVAEDGLIINSYSKSDDYTGYLQQQVELLTDSNQLLANILNTIFGLKQDSSERNSQKSLSDILDNERLKKLKISKFMS